jgi:hypothetical protein
MKQWPANHYATIASISSSGMVHTKELIAASKEEAFYVLHVLSSTVRTSLSNWMRYSGKPTIIAALTPMIASTLFPSNEQ